MLLPSLARAAQPALPSAAVAALHLSGGGGATLAASTASLVKNIIGIGVLTLANGMAAGTGMARANGIMLDSLMAMRKGCQD